MIEPDFLDELKQFDSELKRKVSSIFQGEQKSTHVGEGLTFSDHRNYTPGDDTRLIDWKLYARTNELFIKQYEEERNLTVHVLLDASGSMDYGEGDTNKFEYAAKIGLGFAYLAAAENNDFRYNLFKGTFERIDTGVSNRGEILSIIDLLNETDPEGEADFQQAFEDYASQIRSKSLVLIASDFLGDTSGIEEGLEALSQNYLTLAHVMAPDERELPTQGDTIFESIETGIELRTYLSNRLKKAYQDSLTDHVEMVGEHAEDLQADHVLVDTGEDFFDSFAEIWVE